MSVAFRRESDEEHKEPKFEIPLPSGPNCPKPTTQPLSLIARARVSVQLLAGSIRVFRSTAVPSTVQ